MNILAYLHMFSFVSSLVIRETERVARDLRGNNCKEEKQIIFPVVAQNLNGRIKFIKQQNATHSQLQPVEILKCSHPGSSCSGCLTKQSPPANKVCSNQYKVGPC